MGGRARRTGRMKQCSPGLRACPGALGRGRVKTMRTSEARLLCRMLKKERERNGKEDESGSRKA
jgi:hypothetical protein